MSNINEIPLSDIKPDLMNANRHTERGTSQLKNSIEKFGFAEAGTLDKNNRIIAGNNRTDVSVDVLDPDDVIVIDVDGTKPVFIRRADIDLDTPQGRELAIALNRTAQTGIDFDPEVLRQLDEVGVELGDWWFGFELNNIIGEGNNTDDIWDGMPEFEQEDISAYQEIKVRFMSESAVIEFAQMIGQPITEKTKYIYHPRLVNENLKRYTTE